MTFRHKYKSISTNRRQKMNNLDEGNYGNYMLLASPLALYTSYTVLVCMFVCLFFVIKNAIDYTIIGQMDNYEIKVNFTSRFVFDFI
jgi:hypothetical protein